MIRRTVALLTLLILVLPAASVWPLGVGNIELGSALNEPLSARIPLRSLESGDVDGMKVGLGTADQFQRAGIERPYLLTQLKFDVIETADGGFIRITSPDAIAEPFLNFLLEVNWPRGRVLREYTVLLDPPVYGAAIASTVRQSVPTIAAAPTPAVPGLTTPVPGSASTSSAVQTPSTTTTTRRAPVAGEYGPVAENDTLWSLSERFRPDGGYSVQQTMLAILNANPEAFSHTNVNTLRAGVVLRIPSADEVGALSRAQALEEVKRQHSAWEEIRANLGTARPAPAPEGTMAPETGAASSTDGESAGGTTPGPGAAATAGTQSRLELVGAGSEAAGTVGAPEQATSLDAVRSELSLALEEVEAGRRQTDELGARLTDAEALIDDLRRLVELKDESIAALQQQLAAGEAMPEATGTMPEPETLPIPETMPEPAPVVEMPVAEPPAPEPTAPEPAAPAPQAPEVVAPAPSPPEPQPAKPKVPLPPPPPPTPTSFMDILTDVLPVDPLLLAGGVGGLALLGAVFAVVRRRRRGAEESVEASDGDGPEIGSLIDRFAATGSPADEDATELPSREATDTVIAGPADDDKTVIGGDTRPTPSRVVREEEDPLAEVNNYLAYEHFDQAEELVRNAIEQFPERHEYRLRLLDVLRQARNIGGFAVAASALQEAVGDDSPLTEKATAWWSELSPGSEPFLAGEGTAAADDDFTQTHVGMKEDQIFDVTGTGDAGTSAVDFDLGFEMTGGGDTTELEPDGQDAASGVDFDLGAEVGADNQTGSDLDFVLDDGDATVPEAAAAGDELDFDLGLPDTPVTDDDGAAPAAEVAGDELDFDLSGEPGQGESEPSSTDGDELDFDLGTADEEPIATVSQTLSAAEDDLSFDLDTGTVDAADDDELDFELDADNDNEAAGGLEVDAGDAESEPVDSEAETLVGAADDLDFDLGGGTQETDSDDGGSTSVLAASDDLDLGLGDLDDEFSAVAQETDGVEPGGESASTADDDLDLDLDEAEIDISDDVTLEASADELDIDLGGGVEVSEEAAGDDLDLDLGLDGDADVALPAETASEDDFDLDLGAGDTPAEADAAGSSTAEDLDFDLGADTSPEPVRADTVLDLDFGAGADGSRDDDEAAVADADDLDFDLSGFDTDDAKNDDDPLGLGAGDETREVPSTGNGAEEPLDDSVFDTVKLDVDDMAALGSDDEDEDVLDLLGDDDAKTGGRGEDANVVEDAVEKFDSELDFDISGDAGEEFDFDLDGVESLSLDDEPEGTDDKTLVLGRGAGGELDEAQTKLDLAQAYIDMGDSENARAILGEVMAEGSESQVGEAKALLGKLA